MAQPKVRFLHTSNWRLETPIHGVAEVPAELREAFVDANYLAVERVIEAAIEQRVDFVLAVGDLLPLESACPYTLEFFLRQWDRLAEHGIAFYWLGGSQDDLDLWPASLEIPAHVRLFRAGELQSWTHSRDGRPVATIVGRSERRGAAVSAADYARPDDTAIPRIAAIFGDVPKRTLENKGVDYWALGGQAQHAVIAQGKSTACQAGSPQGLQPAEAGPHGAVLVELDFGQSQLQFIETDVWRWRREKMDASSCTTVEQLQSQLMKAIQQIPAETARFGWLVAWTVACSPNLARLLDTEGQREPLRRTLCLRAAEDARWSLALEIEPAELPAELWEEDSILGDFLRTVRRMEQDPDQWRELLNYVPETEDRSKVVQELSRLLQSRAVDERHRLWREVSAWGADLLQGERVFEIGSRA